MDLFEIIIALLLAAALLSAFAERIAVPYPAILAVAGSAIAFIPGVPAITPEPALVLALFVAPILLDAAYDASPATCGTTSCPSQRWHSSPWALPLR
ncbi:hypothetical protein [Dankookia sp. P2]|uniref:hypothetical protein n=1 Tax=Dankookia sp. P2 TaxID=3423955 RepID=UPI003D6706E3